MKLWYIGGGILATLLLLGFVLNIVLAEKSHSPHPGQRADSLPAPRCDLTGMVRIPAGGVRLGNDALALRAYLSTVASLKADDQTISDLLASWETSDSLDEVDEFWIDQYEVSNAQYAKFVAATRHRSPPHWEGPVPAADLSDHPVTHVSYEDAEQYAHWAGKQLPTEDQWIRAFRGDQSQFYPWGDTFDATRANVKENKSFAGTSRIGATPQDVSPFGVCNLVGNAAEILRGRPFLQDKEMVRIKGSDWQSPGAVFGIGSAGRYFISGSEEPLESYQFQDQQIGFRCIYEAPDH